MKNKLDDLRNHLFEVIEALKDEEKPMDIARAKAVSEVAQTLIETAKTETRYLELVGGQSASDFFLDSTKLPAQNTPRLLK